ncbi:MAG: TraC family protein [Hyphomicrobium sp.]
MTKSHPASQAKAQSAVLTNIDKQIEALQAKRTTMMRKRRETIGLLCERAGLHLIDADVTAIEDALKEVVQRFQNPVPGDRAPRKRADAS